MVSLLHISDLHRDPKNELSNVALLDSLEADRDRYVKEDPSIPAPTLAVVSGDVVYGVKHDHPDPVVEIDRQYEQAYDFLARLAKSFFGGDHNKIVLLPGNHDVSLPVTMNSLEELKVDPTKDLTREIVRQLWVNDSGVRWNWNTLSLWRIKSPSTYLTRLDGFRRFYDRFYDGCNRVKYILDPAKQHDIFDFATEGVVVVAMSSCYHNDPLRRQGMIHPQSVSEIGRTLRQSQYQGKLIISSWHHNTSGGPASADYMESDILQVFIDRGFSIGLHGHQHKPQFIDERYSFREKRKITVLSASTLCAGANAIPQGQRRGYNILCVDTDNYKAKFHQRSMLNDDFLIPIWGQGTFLQTGQSYIEFDVQPPNTTSGISTSPSAPPAATAVLQAVEEDVRSGRFAEAVEKLMPIRDVPLARPLLFEALSQLGDSEQIVKMFMPPVGSGEIVQVAMAAWEIKDLDSLRKLLGLQEVMDSTDPAVRQIRERFSGRIS